MKRQSNFLKTYRLKRLKHRWNRKLHTRMYFQVHSAPPPVWISRTINPYPKEIFQPAFHRGCGDFFWNNPMKIATLMWKKKKTNKQITSSEIQGISQFLIVLTRNLFPWVSSHNISCKESKKYLLHQYCIIY